MDVAKLRIIVADDNPPFLQSLISVLDIECDVVATPTDGMSARELIRRYDPDPVVLDLTMPKLNGMEVTRELAKNPACAPVVIAPWSQIPKLWKPHEKQERWRMFSKRGLKKSDLGCEICGSGARPLSHRDHNDDTHSRCEANTAS